MFLVGLPYRKLFLGNENKVIVVKDRQVYDETNPINFKMSCQTSLSSFLSSEDKKFILLKS